MIRITDSMSLNESEISESFVRSSGPGGQNVNKVATAVQLRFNLRHSRSLPADVRERAEKLAGARLTKAGVLIISADRFRTQERNRADALMRLVALLRRAAIARKKRRPTKPIAAARERRLKAKLRRGEEKRLRRVSPSEE